MAEDTITVGANSQQAVDIAGRFFACLSCTKPFKVEFDHEGQRLCSAGVKFSFGSFSRIVFTDTSGADNTITYYAGDSEYDGVVPSADGAVPVIESPDATFDYPYLMDDDGSLLSISHYVGSPLVFVPGTAKPLPEEITIDGKNYRRKSFHIANRTNDDLAIHKATGECIDILNSNDNRTFNFSFDVVIQFMSSGGTNKVALYYTLFSDPIA